jgi:putative Mg2+ transporter-C (MgtC) family protein
MLDWTDAVIRLLIATLIGAAIGLDRDLHGKPSGVRTLGIVSLGSAAIVLASQYPAHAIDTAAASRVMQGIITGIGFLGAGVILRNPKAEKADGPSAEKVRGMTTAASIWLTACIGASCGAGAWPVVVTAAILVFLILTLGKSIERTFERLLPPRGSTGDGESGPEGW